MVGWMLRYLVNRMCSLNIECVLLRVARAKGCRHACAGACVYTYYRVCSLNIECVLLHVGARVLMWQRVRVRMCSLTIECVLLLQNVSSYYRMCSLAIECVLLL